MLTRMSISNATQRNAILALAALLVIPTAAAQNRLELGGFIDLNIKRLHRSPGTATQLSSGGLNNSRFKFSGSEALGEGNTAYFTIEPTFAANTGVQAAQYRQSFVGIRGNWGDLTLGRQFTPSYWTAGYADPSWAAEFSMVNNMQFFYAAYRVDEAVQYKTPTLHGFTARFMLSNGGRPAGNPLEYRSGPLFVGLASEKKYTANIFVPALVHSSRDHYLSAVYRLGSVEPTFIFHTYNGYYAFPPWTAFNAQGWDVQLGVRWNIDGTNRFYASAVHRQDDENSTLANTNGFVLGMLHGLSKRTDLYATVAHVQHRRAAAVPHPVTFLDYPNAGQNPTGYQIGIRHAF